MCDVLCEALRALGVAFRMDDVAFGAVEKLLWRQRLYMQLSNLIQSESNQGLEHQQKHPTHSLQHH